MSTRSIVGTIDEAGHYRGRYVHSDGAPSSRGPVLAQLLAQYDGGLDQLLTVLIDDHFGWSFLAAGHGCSEGDSRASHIGDRGVSVKGVGLAYTDCSDDEWATGQESVSGDVEEWGYFFTSRDSATAELVIVEGGSIPTEVARIKVTELHKLDRDAWIKIECGEHFERCSHYAWYHFPEVERFSRLSTCRYLGREPLRPSDAVAAVYRGHTYQLTGSGYTGGYGGRHGANREGWWYATGRHEWGYEWAVPIMTKGGRVPAGVDLIYPALRADADLVAS